MNKHTFSGRKFLEGREGGGAEKYPTVKTIPGERSPLSQFPLRCRLTYQQYFILACLYPPPPIHTLTNIMLYKQSSLV